MQQARVLRGRPALASGLCLSPAHLRPRLLCSRIARYKDDRAPDAARLNNKRQPNVRKPEPPKQDDWPELRTDTGEELAGITSPPAPSSPTPTPAAFTPVDAESGVPLTAATTPPIDMPGPFPAPSYLGVPINSLIRLGLGLTAAGWIAIAAASLLAPSSTVQLLFPNAVDQAGSSVLLALWGASLIPLGFATQALKGATDSNMAGTPAANQLNAAVLTGCGLTLLVTLQAISLRNGALSGSVGAVSAAGLALTTGIATQVHPWKLPLPSVTGIVSSLLSLVRPSSWASSIFSIITISLAVTAAGLLRTVPGDVNVLLGGAQTAASLAVFINRAVGAAFMSQGIVCLLLKEAADKKLLAAPTACRLSGTMALSALCISAVLGIALMGGTAAGTRTLWTILLGQLGVCAWMTAAYLKPTELELAALPSGTPSVLGSAARLERAGEMTPTQFFAAMTTRPQPWDV